MKTKSTKSASKTQEIVINDCYGGFSLSHKGVMLYAKLAGFKLYAFTDTRGKDGHLDFKHFVPCAGNKHDWMVHYSKKPLKKDGTYVEDSYFHARDIPRDDKNLISVVKQLGKKADGDCAKLKIVKIPVGVKWEISEYDGIEHVAESHERWS
jgi:hypothetical protein